VSANHILQNSLSAENFLEWKCANILSNLLSEFPLHYVTQDREGALELGKGNPLSKSWVQLGALCEDITPKTEQNINEWLMF
jgi:hypothetical protein